ncbi:hypothetical protein P4284_16130 [Bacillus swezeyi]|nr:hypothetical protein [Bacillus swezeyi]MED2978216.1 hypothetical protein [Bacillus swezeyi]
MNVFKVYCNGKKGYWRVIADSESEAIYEVTKGYETHTGVYAIQII